MKFRSIIALVFIILIVVFSIQNIEITDVKFLFWTLSISRVLVVLGSFSIGIAVGILVSMKKKKGNTHLN